MDSVDTAEEVPRQTIKLGGRYWFAVYVVMSLIIQWPLVGALSTHISYGREQEITVPMLNLWTVWWNADRLGHGFRGYWDAPIFYPTHNTFIFSEAQPTSLIVAPLLALTDNRALAYNVYQLLILTLNGYSAHRLLRRLGHIPWLAFCGGVMTQILPFVMWQFGVVQLTTLFGIQWTLHAILDLFGTADDSHGGSDEDCLADRSDEERPRWQFTFPIGLRLGLAYGLTYWLCNYWGLFQTILFTPCCVVFCNRRMFDRQFWSQVLLAAVVGAIMIGPFAWLQRSMSHEHQWQESRTSDMVYDLSAHWRDHTDLPWPSLFPFLEIPDRARENVWGLGGGGLKLLLAPLGLIVSICTPRRRRWGLFAALIGLVSFGLSLGTTIQFLDQVPYLGGIRPYELLQKCVPGFSLIRSPFRFAVFVQLACVWLSVEALDLFNPTRWLSPWDCHLESNRGHLPSWLRPLFGLQKEESIPFSYVIPLVTFSSLVTLEAVPPPMALYELPSPKGLPVWVCWLRDNAEPNKAVACLPYPTGFNVGDYEETTIWMYWSTFFHRPLANGYSGFFPDSFMKTKEALEQFVRPANLEPEEPFVPGFKNYAGDNPGLYRLGENHVRYVVVKRSFGTRDDIGMHPATRFRWALVASDEFAQIDIYQLPLWSD